ETAAEALRLRMLSSALSIGSEPEQAVPQKNGVQGLLNKFLAQLPEHNAAASPAAGSASAAGTGAGEAAANPALEPALTPASEPGSGAAPTEALIEKASRRYGVD